MKRRTQNVAYTSSSENGLVAGMKNDSFKGSDKIASIYKHFRDNIRFEPTVSMHSSFDFKNRLYCCIIIPTSPLISSLKDATISRQNLLQDSSLVQDSMPKQRNSFLASISKHFAGIHMPNAFSGHQPLHLIDVDIPESILDHRYIMKYRTLAVRLEQELAIFRHRALLDGRLQGAQITEFDRQWGIDSVYLPKNPEKHQRRSSLVDTLKSSFSITDSQSKDKNNNCSSNSNNAGGRKKSLFGISSLTKLGSAGSTSGKERSKKQNPKKNASNNNNSAMSRFKKAGRTVMNAIKFGGFGISNDEPELSLDSDVIPSIKWKNSSLLGYKVAKCVSVLEINSSQMMKELPQHALASNMMKIFVEERLGRTNNRAATYHRKISSDFIQSKSVPNMVKVVLVGVLLLVNAFFIFFCIANAADLA
jgi:hypothetical protein